MSKNYARGRKKEYAIRSRLIKEGYDIVQRSAGSHSPVDIFAISKKLKQILLIQSKPKGYKGKKYEEYDWLNDIFEVFFRIE